MAAGDIAAAAGMDVVAESGEEGKVWQGAREINKTRDYVAERASREGLRISIGTADPSGGEDADIYFKVI
jgi:hypothetical protein